MSNVLDVEYEHKAMHDNMHDMSTLMSHRGWVIYRDGP